MATDNQRKRVACMAASRDHLDPEFDGHILDLLDRVAELEADNTKLRAVLKKVQSMAGAPDAAEACRQIIKVVDGALKEAGFGVG